MRTTRTRFSFARPFTLQAIDEVLPAGSYEVDTDEELLEGVSFPAYRRVQTVIHLHAVPGRPGITRSLTVDPADLEAALARDGEAAAAGLPR